MRLYIILFICLFVVSCHTKTKTDSIEYPTINAIADNKKMVQINAGKYQPFFSSDSIKEVQIKTFLFDESPVTNAEYLEFIKANPQWSKSKVLKLYADSNYLRDWISDLELPKGISADAPITNISWYAAKAYAQSVGKRLPTVDEWEFVAVADEFIADASNDPAFTNKILESYKIGERYKTNIKSTKPNFYGVYDLYGSVWEWTSDFNSVMITGESRDNNKKSEDLFCAGASLTSSDLKNYAAFIRFAMRGSLKANYCIYNLGFRCAKDIPNKDQNL